MQVRYADKNLEQICTDARYMQQKVGSQVAKTLKLRIAELHRVNSMADLLLGTGRWEELHGDRAGYWSARLTANRRLIVLPEGESQVSVLVVELVDYHRR